MRDRACRDVLPQGILDNGTVHELTSLQLVLGKYASSLADESKARKRAMLVLQSLAKEQVLSN